MDHHTQSVQYVEHLSYILVVLHSCKIVHWTCLSNPATRIDRVEKEIIMADGDGYACYN